MNRLCVLLMLVVATTAIGVEKRIIGGTAVSILSHPYTVSVQYNKVHYCGGALVKPNKVLTAGECIKSQATTMVIAGATDLTSPTVAWSPIQRFVVHPEFRSATLDCDIAVITLATNFPTRATLSPIPLVGVGKKPQPGAMMLVTGWGYVEMQGPVTRYLQAVQLPVVGYARCDAAYKDSQPPYVTDRVFCAGEGFRGPFVHDGGTPAVNEQKQLAGLASWGSKTNAYGIPSVFTDLSHAVIRRFVDDNLV